MTSPFCLLRALSEPPPLVQIPGCGASSCLSGVEPQPQPRSPPAGPALPQPPAWTRPLRTPGPRPRVPRLTRLGGGMQGCGGSETLRDKHAEMPEERGRDAPRDAETETGRWQRHFQRHRQSGGQAELHPETRRTPRGCASHAAHRRAHRYTRPHAPSAGAAPLPSNSRGAGSPGGRGCVRSSRAPGRVVRVRWGLRGARRREPTPPRGA